MTEPIRRVEQYSPKTSPRGARSPVVPRQDSSGTLKTTISLGKTPSIVHTGPFYLMKDLPYESEVTGETNFMAYHNLEHAYNKYCGKKVKDSLSSFLPSLPGMIDVPGSQDNSSLRSLIDKPPIGGKEICPLTSSQLSGFRLHPGPLPDQYRFMNQLPPKKKKKTKHGKRRDGEVSEGLNTDSSDKSKQKKHKKDHEEKRKKKKEKKKKKQKHSPEHPGNSSSQHPS